MMRSVEIDEREVYIERRIYINKIIFRILIIILAVIFYQVTQYYIDIIHEYEYNKLNNGHDVTNLEYDLIYDIFNDFLFKVSVKTANIILISSSLFMDILSLFLFILFICAKTVNSTRGCLEFLFGIFCRQIISPMLE
eukprot:508308_1